jgi:hypothetical protein
MDTPVVLVDALEAGDEFFGEWLARLGPQEAAGDAAVFFDQQGEGEKFFHILLDVDLGVFIEREIFIAVERGVEDPG